MKIRKFAGLLFLIFMYMIMTVPFQGCNPDEDEIDTSSYVYKPNIYIYPKENMDLSVKLLFPKGGKILTSIPEYGAAWNVSVDTNGLINDTYTYLFYESNQPDIWQREYGWIIQADDLEAFFRQNMTDYGFKGREIDDFIDYWIPRLNEYPFYLIYPQTKTIIDDVIELEFSKQPEYILRLFYVIEGHDQYPEQLYAPEIPAFSRDGYFVTEWGVIL
jgi:hypothetical protein